MMPNTVMLSEVLVIDVPIYQSMFICAPRRIVDELVHCSMIFCEDKQNVELADLGSLIPGDTTSQSLASD